MPERGDRIDVTLSDGRSFKSADVIKAEADTVLILSGGTLTSFKPQDIRVLKLSGGDTVAPAPTNSVAPKASQPPPSVAAVVQQQPSTPLAPPKTVEHVVPEPPITKSTMAQNAGSGILLVGLLAALAFAHWQRRARLKFEVEAKRLGVFANELKSKLAGLEVRYSGLIDVDKVLDEKKHEIQTAVREIQQRTSESEILRSEITELKKQLNLFEGEENLVACGHYRPAFDFNTSDEFKKAIDEIRERQRDFIKDEQAAFCSEKWTVNGSETEGRKATKRTLRLMLRAFNGESDAIIARVSWNNIDRMLERLQAVFDAINKLGDSYKCYLNREYLQMKRKELQLTFEYEDKIKKEKDEQRELKERMRDEERARREIEDALKQTALDEERAKKAIEQARAELQEASGAKEASLNEKIRLLEGKLQEALKNKERAISRAQQTRSGHVYIISNIGSFGETVFKIGMTRRLEPYERVQELGDASVPFAFDVHGMIYTEDAPTLESKLHQRFDHHRVNLVNERKEFFHLTMDELQAAVKEFGAAIELSRLAEAREYRETLERKKAMTK